MNRTVMALALFIAGCSAAPYDVSVEPNGNRIVTGHFTRSVFTADSVMNVWYSSRYRTYEPDAADLRAVAAAAEGVRFVVILGTWCGDSKREIPHFYRIADMAGIPEERIDLYGVDRSKKGMDGVEERYHLDRVPTIVVERQGREVGRIVEMPVETLEKDLRTILEAK
ncbi:MAG: thioredoxin family protein [Bacteroidetes bacterium]|nr:MAG: thioredoxin family protein [Bacteroidota bacterium]